MSVLYVVFKNRTTTLLFFNKLKSFGVQCGVIDTPKKILASCGLSVEVDIKYLKKIIPIVRNIKSSDFYGLYKNNYGNSYYEKIV